MFFVGLARRTGANDVGGDANAWNVSSYLVIRIFGVEARTRARD